MIFFFFFCTEVMSYPPWQQTASCVSKLSAWIFISADDGCLAACWADQKCCCTGRRCEDFGDATLSKTMFSHMYVDFFFFFSGHSFVNWASGTSKNRELCLVSENYRSKCVLCTLCTACPQKQMGSWASLKVLIEWKGSWSSGVNMNRLPFDRTVTNSLQRLVSLEWRWGSSVESLS